MTPTAKETRNLARLILAGGENADLAKTIIEGNPDLLPDLAAEFEYNGFGEMGNRFDVREPETWWRLKCSLCVFRKTRYVFDDWNWLLSYSCSLKCDTFPNPCTKFKDRNIPF